MCGAIFSKSSPRSICMCSHILEQAPAYHTVRNSLHRPSRPRHPSWLSTRNAAPPCTSNDRMCRSAVRRSELTKARLSSGLAPPQVLWPYPRKPPCNLHARPSSYPPSMLLSPLLRYPRNSNPLTMLCSL
ncbi:hypothetical protein C2E23DRAFT_539951 [Lenzites betulinus]|nr:hypothetical protein C2E23DRAFT_539951 [Lenzites betulinus]